MMTSTTTAHALDARAQQYVDANPQDSVALANHLIDEALRLQDQGCMDEAEALLDRAETLL